MPPRFPVLWFTVLIFAVVAAATRDSLGGPILFVFVLPLVLLGQCLIRWLFRRLRSPVRVRRAAMLFPALVLGSWIFHATNGFGGKQIAAVRIALAGQKPSGIQELHVKEDSWTDYSVSAYFRCDPASLRSILEKHPFTRSHYYPDSFSFTETPFPELRDRPGPQDVITFSRIDLEESGLCRVYTDSKFSFAYITYAVD